MFDCQTPESGDPRWSFCLTGFFSFPRRSSSVYFVKSLYISGTFRSVHIMACRMWTQDKMLGKFYHIYVWQNHIRCWQKYIRSDDRCMPSRYYVENHLEANNSITTRPIDCCVDSCTAFTGKDKAGQECMQVLRRVAIWSKREIAKDIHLLPDNSPSRTAVRRQRSQVDVKTEPTYSTVFFDCGSGKWWTTETMLDQVKTAFSIFKRTYPDFTGLLAFRQCGESQRLRWRCFGRVPYPLGLPKRVRHYSCTSWWISYLVHNIYTFACRIYYNRHDVYVSYL